MKHSNAFGAAMSTALHQELTGPTGPDDMSIKPHKDLTEKRINTAFCYKMWGLGESGYSSNATPATPSVYKTYGNATHKATWITTWIEAKEHRYFQTALFAVRVE
jgi:hypothetical protein